MNSHREHAGSERIHRSIRSVSRRMYYSDLSDLVRASRLLAAAASYLAMYHVRNHHTRLYLCCRCHDIRQKVEYTDKQKKQVATEGTEGTQKASMGSTKAELIN